MGLEDKFVKNVETTDLKAAQISENIPLVAAHTQGDVITFASSAANQVRFILFKLFKLF